MRKISAILITAILTLSLTACGSANADSNSHQSTDAAASQSANNQSTAQDTPELTAEEALDIALKHADIAKDNITNLESKLDNEHGRLVYEIEFDSASTEYSYEINAMTGDIVEYDSDRID